MLFLGWVLAASPEGSGRVIALAAELNVMLAPYPAESSILAGMGWGAAAVARLVPAFVSARLAYGGLTLLLAALVAAVLILLIYRLQPAVERADDEGNPDDEGQSIVDGRTAVYDALPFVLLLIGTAVLLTLGPEFVYLKDVFSQRLNTIFKFYYQAWLLFGVAAVFGLNYLWNRFRLTGAAAVVLYGAALASALLFPLYAVQSRSIEYRGAVTAENRQPATLNGLAYHHGDEYAALLWLRENVNGSAVILEAVGGSYTGYARVSASTGIPTVLGWPGHEHQWRGSTAEPGEREPAVRTIYSLVPWPETAALLNKYGVTHIYYGSLEKTTYDPLAGDKFDQNLEIAYQNDSVTIYRWQPE
jgi:hypothetical protein